MHSQATNILTDYASDDPALLADLLMDADPEAFASLFPFAAALAYTTSPMFRAELRKTARAEDEQTKDELAERQARAGVALIRLGKAEEVWPLLRHSADPRLRSLLVNWLNPLRADAKTIVAEVDRLDSLPRPAVRAEGGRAPSEGPPGPTTTMSAILFHPETSMRRALILALGTYGADGLSQDERESLIVKLLDLYRNDPDAGIHGASEWTLRQWKEQARLEAAQVELSNLVNRGERRWYVNRQGQSFVMIEGPVEFRMGSPPDEPYRDADETPHRQVIPRRFAIADKEVTVEQYHRFARVNSPSGVAQISQDRYSPGPNGPMIAVSWFAAAAYCNWLSMQEGLPEDQWCYRSNERGEYDQGMTIVPDALNRFGYRLPTEAEWEYACRAGSVTNRYYGHSLALLGKYAWYAANNQDHAWPSGSLQPNDLGLFDMLGNAYEWCQERYESYEPAKTESKTIEINIDKVIDIRNQRSARGGSFVDLPGYIRSASRGRFGPTDRIISNGFRPAKTYR